MKYPKIASLVPQGEHFDESAIVNEGGWVSTQHLTSIESTLASLDGMVPKSELDAANAIATAHEATIAEMQTAATASQAAIATHEAKITELNSTIAVLAKRSSGKTGSTVGAGKSDENAKEEVTSSRPKYNDPNHPANKAAAQRGLTKK